MMISTKGRYALRVLVDMAEHPSPSNIPLKEIAERQEISEKYLENIVKDLVKAGVIKGLRGKGGGYQLNRAPDQINVYDVICLLLGACHRHVNGCTSLLLLLLWLMCFCTNGFSALVKNTHRTQFLFQQCLGSVWL